MRTKNSYLVSETGINGILKLKFSLKFSLKTRILYTVLMTKISKILEQQRNLLICLSFQKPFIFQETPENF